jgi:hypothetical protein
MKKKTYAILRTEKVKSWASLGKSVGHNMRTSGDARSHLAKNFAEPIRVLAGDPAWQKPWRKEVGAMWLPGLKQGDRHTLAREFFLGASPEFFVGKDAAAVSEWATENVAWLVDRFGADRVKLAVLHFDEQSPHVAAYVVPLKADANRAGVVNTSRGNGWTLSDTALGLGGNKSDLVKLQDDYAARMQRFGLERGERGSKADHQTIRQWLAQMRATLPDQIPFPKPLAATLADRLDINGYGERVAKAAALEVHRKMQPAYRQAKKVPALEAQIKRQAGLIEWLRTATEALKQALGALLGVSVDLDTPQGIQALQEAVLASKPTPAPAPSGDTPNPPPIKAKAIDAAQRRRAARGRAPG